MTARRWFAIALIALAALLLAGCGQPEDLDPVYSATTVTIDITGDLPPIPLVADATEVAVRITTTSTTDPCAAAGLACQPFYAGVDDHCAEMNFYRIQWGLPARFDDSGRHQSFTPSDGIGWRESKCTNDALSYNGGCCGGYFQLFIREFIRNGNAGALAMCDVDELADVMGNIVDGEHNDPVGMMPYNKQRQACVAAWVLSVSGIGAWAPLS